MASESTFVPRPRSSSVETGVSKYDQVNASLQALLILVGLLVSMMFMMWLTSNYKPKRTMAMIDISEAEGEEGEKDPLGVGDDAFEPGVEEFPDVETPQLMDSLEAVTNAVSSISANNEFRDGDAAEMGKGRGLGNRLGGGGGGGGVIPAYKRWRIEYEASDIDEYARQLSFFKIEIGAASKDSDVIVVLQDPAGIMQVIQSNRDQENKTLRFAHLKQKLQKWDEKLLKRVNVSAQNNLVFQFYRDEVRSLLLSLEKQLLDERQKTLKQVKNTFFKIVEKNGAFEFQITDQIYR